jgi:RNA polymerase sigma factor (sigma-70 family)
MSSDFNNEDIIQTLQQQEQPDKALILELWQSNQGLIQKTLRRYRGLADYEDMQQEAFIAFFNAVFAFNSDVGARFSTFLVTCLINHISGYIQSSQLVRVPRAIKALKIEYNKAFNQLSQEYGREPTTAEIAEYIGCTREDIQALAGTGQTASLDEQQGGAEDEECTLLDTLKSSEDVENGVIEQNYQEYEKTALWGLLEACLTDRENDILEAHYRQNKTLQEVAKVQGISEQRAAKIEQDSFQKLRRNPKIKKLAEELQTADSMLFRGNVKAFKQTGSSIVERIAVKVDEALTYHYKTREEFNKSS